MAATKAAPTLPELRAIPGARAGCESLRMELASAGQEMRSAGLEIAALLQTTKCSAMSSRRATGRTRTTPELKRRRLAPTAVHSPVTGSSLRRFSLRRAGRRTRREWALGGVGSRLPRGGQGMNKITLELETHEAIIVLGRITDAALSASELAAKSSGEEHEILDLNARVLSRVQTRLTDAIYPVCVYPRGDGGDVCGREFAGHNKGHAYCRFHLDLETMHDIGVPA